MSSAHCRQRAKNALRHQHLLPSRSSLGSLISQMRKEQSSDKGPRKRVSLAKLSWDLKRLWMVWRKSTGRAIMRNLLIRSSG